METEVTEWSIQQEFETYGDVAIWSLDDLKPGQVRDESQRSTNDPMKGAVVVKCATTFEEWKRRCLERGISASACDAISPRADGRYSFYLVVAE